MADSRKYYYLKLKEDFFDSDELKIMQSMPDGYLYSDILLKLYLKSLQNEGRLMYRGIIPYTPLILSTLTNHSVGTVEKALQVFQELGLVEVLDNGAIYMLDIQNFIGKSSTVADRKREYRNAINDEKNRLTIDKNTESQGQMSGQMSTVCPLENRDKENRDKENRDKENRVVHTASKDTVSRTDVQRVLDAWNQLSSLGITPVSKITSGTKRADGLNARIRQYGVGKVLEAIERIKRSDFLQGRNNRGWSIKFDWFILPSNFPKVLEGNYDNQIQVQSTTSSVEEYANMVRSWANND